MLRGERVAAVITELGGGERGTACSDFPRLMRLQVMSDWARQGARDTSPESLPLADPPPLASHDPRPSHAIRHFDEGLDESASHSGFSDLLENYSMNVLPNYCRFKLRKGWGLPAPIIPWAGPHPARILTHGPLAPKDSPRPSRPDPPLRGQDRQQ